MGGGFGGVGRDCFKKVKNGIAGKYSIDNAGFTHGG